MHILDMLKERGFIAQVTFEDDLYKALEREPMTFYVGFDPTADSLHVGHYIPIMAMAHLQRAGHRPIALCGGGTAMIGDPSGKSDMRKMMSRETIAQNVLGIQKQLSRFLDFSDGKALMVNNGDWLLNLNYIDFLREVGALFSVNRMLTAECYRRRLETGLTFLEFNYMLMQSYDFLQLFKNHGCRLQVGGDDQWSNMLSGADLIRRKEHEDAFALTCKLIMTHDGKKMGKTEKGALWLDAQRTSPYEFYQYWRNVGDQDVERFLALLTFLPMDEVRRLGALQGCEINEAKKVLAFEVTKLVHGEEEARKADVILFLENFLEGIKNGRIKNGAENFTPNTCKVWSNFLGILKRFIQIYPFTWKDINIKAKTVNVDHQLIYKNLGDGCKFHISTPKTESGIRIIPMTQEVAKAFEEQRKINFMLAKDKSIEVDGYSGFVFTAKSGRPLMPNGVNSVLYNIVDAYNKTEVERAKKEHRKAELLPKFSAHVMRHTACTRMAECRMDVKVLQYIMGHAHIDVTMEVYNHIGELTRIENEIARLDSMVLNA